MRDGIVPVMEVNGNNGNSGFGGFGNDGAWWIIILLIFGFGRNGFGGGFGGGSGVQDMYTLASDFSQISRQISDSTAMTERKLDSITNGICTLGYDNLVQANSINSNINNIGMNLQNCCCEVKSQLADCCCQNLRAIDGVNFNLSQGFCGVNNTINTGVRDIIENQNNNYRALHDEIIANRIEDLKEENRRLTAQNTSLELSASQSRQNNYLLNELRNGCPVNAQLVCGNTPIPVQYVTAGCGCNSCGNY